MSDCGDCKHLRGLGDLGTHCGHDSQAYGYFMADGEGCPHFVERKTRRKSLLAEITNKRHAYEERMGWWRWKARHYRGRVEAAEASNAAHEARWARVMEWARENKCACCQLGFNGRYQHNPVCFACKAGKVDNWTPPAAWGVGEGE